MSERFAVEVDIIAKDKTEQALKGAKSGFKEAFDEVLTGAMRRAGESALGFVQQLPAMTVELTKLGASAKAQGLRFERFAGSTGQATKLLDAFNEGSLNTVDRMTAMGSAGRLLQMGLVETSDEMQQVAAMATRLGDQTMDAGSRIADFAAMLANQSIPRLDNFGISSGRVRQRINELIESGQALNREQAFKMAVMEEGAKSLERLGDTTDTAAHKMAVLEASVQEARIGFGELLIEMVEATGGVDDFAGRVRNLPNTVRQVSVMVHAADLALRELQTRGLLARPVETFNDAMRRGAAAMMDVAHTSEVLRYQHLQTANAVGDETRRYDELRMVSEQTLGALHDQVTSQGMLEHTILNAAAALEDETEAMEDFGEAAMNAAEQQLNLAAQYTSFEQDATENAERFREQRERIERKHQEALDEIAEKGASRRVRVDEENLRLEVRIAQGRLQELLERQAEFNEETTDLERARAERSIRTLQEEIAEKTQTLEAAHDGYVRLKGRNVDELLAEENRQYQTSLTSLEESQAAQEEAQRQSLGRMVLAHFNAWAEMTLATDGYTREEAQFVTQMRTEISQEYGLISDAAVQAMNEQESKWAAMIAQMQGEASGFFGYFMQQFNALPSEKVIHIRTELATAETAAGRLGGETMQRGSAFAGGGYAWVGEQGPEMTYIPRGASVFPADQSRHMTNHYNLTVNSAATAGRISDEFAMMESLAS